MPDRLVGLWTGPSAGKPMTLVVEVDGKMRHINLSLAETIRLSYSITRRLARWFG